MATMEVKQYLERLEEAIDLDWERRKIDTWKRVLDFQPTDGGFESCRGVDGKQPGDWPRIRINDAIQDPARMLLRELAMTYEVACRRTHHIPNIRCNYGTCIMPSLFGAQTFWMDDDLDTLPTSRPVGESAIDALLDKGIPDLSAGFGRQVFETAEYFKTMLAPYPKISEVVWIYHPDLQGPIDIVEMLWGSNIFYAFYDQPDKVKAITEIVTQTYIRVLTRWFEVVPPRTTQYMAHWGSLWKGQALLRNDSIVNLSVDMYKEFVRPYDQRILDTFGSGAIHFCGHADHCIDALCECRHLTAINPSQPHLNDMRRIHAASVGRGVVLNCPKSRHLDGLDVSRGVVFSSISDQ